MKTIDDWLLLAISLCSLGADWQIAQPGWQYQFPRDHHIHENFKTEWWYFTGNLITDHNRRFGYELTFFRQGVRPPGARAGTKSRFVVDDLKFAHFTVTDAADGKFFSHQEVSRGSFGEAGFGAGNRLAWINSWSLTMNDDGSFDLASETKEAQIALHLLPAKQPVIHGPDGISHKAEGAGHASHYYSITRLQTSGRLRVHEMPFEVQGESWFDHEWASNQLTEKQSGWNWLSAQFDDGSDLMLYEMRLKNGEIDPISSGTFVRSDGSAISLTKADFRMSSNAVWRSKRTGAEYPVGWDVELPAQHLRFTVRAIMSDQELVFSPLVYWEGAVDLSGKNGLQPIRGRGYLELTGYAESLPELNR